MGSLAQTVSSLGQGVQALSGSVTGLTGALGALSNRVDDPTTGLGQTDTGVIGVYITPNDANGNPDESHARLIAPLFVPNVPLDRGSGATTSGTTPVPCSAPNGCTVQLFAKLESNRPQPPSGRAAAQVGGALTVSSVSTGGGSPVGGAESFYDAGQTPGADSAVDIPSRSALGSNYPGPDDTAVPLTSPFKRQSSVKLDPGFYILHGTVSFLHVTGR